MQKTHQGGLINKGNSKTVYVYPASNKKQCPVAMDKKYTGLLPQSKSCKKLYLRVHRKPNAICWYSDQPYGVNKVISVVKEICKFAGIEGRFTNHSLHATSASHMF